MSSEPVAGVDVKDRRDEETDADRDQDKIEHGCLSGER
jgi:hypothetical protein